MSWFDRFESARALCLPANLRYRWRHKKGEIALTAPRIKHVPLAADGLSHEMAMLDAAATSRAALATFWQAETPALVLPERFTREAPFAQAAVLSAARGWPVVGRKTGGGITPQGPGVLNLALCFTVPSGQSRAIRASYARIVDPMRAAFSELGIASEATPVTGSFCDGDYNLAVEGRKLVGTAQRWRGPTCLIHALILTDIAIEPAVDAVTALSRNLGHETAFDARMHCRLKDLLPGETDANDVTADALWQTVQTAGYAPFLP